MLLFTDPNKVFYPQIAIKLTDNLPLVFQVQIRITIKLKRNSQNKLQMPTEHNGMSRQHVDCGQTGKNVM